MEKRIEVYLLSMKDWRHCLAVSATVYSGPDREVCVINPENLEDELEALRLLGKRLAVDFYDCTGDPDVSRALQDEAGLSFKGALLGPGAGLSELSGRFGFPRGLVCAPAADPSRCLQAAALAVRLGLYFLPLDQSTTLPFAALPAAFILWLGREQELRALTQAGALAAAVCLEGDKEVLDYLKQAGCLVDYLVILNSADLHNETRRGCCLGELWVQGLSLLSTVLASYRNTFILDAAAEQPDPAKIEAAVNELAGQTGLKPKFQVVLASPAVVPFFYEEKKTIGGVAEEMVRDIHLRLNDDLFFDVAEGRLFQHYPGGLSLQLISTKRYPLLREEAGAGIEREVLVVSTPHVESGIIFATDEALIDSQLIPLLDQAGCRLNHLTGRDSHYRNIGEALIRADIFLYTGHGGPESLHTHGRALTRYDLPPLPPLVVYASACSTVGLVPHWFSPTEGMEWQGVEVNSREVIGLSFVEKGALVFVGGATVEDLQYSTSIYSIFMEALLVKGLSVGQAVQATRNFISLYASTLLQKAPQAYRKYRWSTANAIHQQVLLGDPAFVPAVEKSAAAALPREMVIGPGVISLSVTIPKERWRRSRTAVNDKEPSKQYYRCRGVDVITPFAEDVISWGDYYRVAPDTENISETAVMSSFLHLCLDLPPDTVPVGLYLQEARAGRGDCLLCGKEAARLALSAVELARHFKLPYLLQPPLELDMRDGWAFTVEQREGFARMHWLAPLLLIDESTRSAFPLESLLFKVETAPARICRGRVESGAAADERGTFLVAAGLPQKQSQEGAETERDLSLRYQQLVLTRPGGSFEISCSGGSVLIVQEQYPLYEIPGTYRAFHNQTWSTDGPEPLILRPEPPNPGILRGRIYDSRTGEPLCGALIRAFRGESDPVRDPLVEAYAGEAAAGLQGDFSLQLPAGKYLLYAVAALNGKRYKSGEWTQDFRRGEEHYRIFTLDEAAVVRGKVIFEGETPPEPAVIAVKKFPREVAGTLSKMPVQRDGRYECLVSFQERFMIILEEEGWRTCEDTNAGCGYRLQPGEILERSFILIPSDT